MTRQALRKGFTLQPAPGGTGHLTDSRTGDVLLVPAADYALLSSGAAEGLDPTRGDVAEVLNRYRPFYGDYVAPASFYELDIEDAPTVPQIPSIAPVTLAQAPQPQVELSPAQAAANDEPETKDDLPLAELMPDSDDEPAELTQPSGQQAVVAPAQEDQLNAAQETHRTEQVEQPPEVAAPPARLAAPDQPAEAAPSSSKPGPLLLAFAGLLLLGLGVGATFLLRPDLFAESPTQPNPTTVVPPPKPEPLPPEPVPQPVVDAGAEPEVVDAGTVELVDAGAPVLVAVVDAGSVAEVVNPHPDLPKETGEGGEWLESAVQARGRVKMGEVLAGASGVVTWSVQEEERVKTKQSLGNIARENGSESPLTSPNVGLAMLKQPSGATVKRGEAIADVIYFEAWAKALVKGKPTTAWRCEIVSAEKNQRADCKISVITPKSGGSQLMVAVEPRWFDDAADAVLRVAPP